MKMDKKRAECIRDHLYALFDHLAKEYDIEPEGMLYMIHYFTVDAILDCATDNEGWAVITQSLWKNVEKRLKFKSDASEE